MFKPIFGLVLVIAIIALGFTQVSQWLTLLFGALLTVAYINGKWFIWKDLVAQRDRNFYQSLLATYAVETLIAFALYWLGRGVSDLL